MSKTIHGSLGFFANTGEIGITTKGAYQESKLDKTALFAHCNELQKEVASGTRWGGNVKKDNSDKATVKIDTKAMKIFMKKAGLTKMKFFQVSKIASVTFYKAYDGKSIYMMTAKKMAKILDADVNDLIKEQ